MLHVHELRQSVKDDASAGLRQVVAKGGGCSDRFIACLQVPYELQPQPGTTSLAADDTFRMMPGLPASIRRYFLVHKYVPLMLISWYWSAVLATDTKA